MKRARVSNQAVVMVEIRGFKQDQPGDTRPRVRNDHGLVSELLDWQINEKIRSVHTPYSGGGSMVAYYEPWDATRVLRWLEENNERDE
jgi:hypothetical protein